MKSVAGKIVIVLFAGYFLFSTLGIKLFVHSCNAMNVTQFSFNSFKHHCESTESPKEDSCCKKDVKTLETTLPEKVAQNNMVKSNQKDVNPFIHCCTNAVKTLKINLQYVLSKVLNVIKFVFQQLVFISHPATLFSSIKIATVELPPIKFLLPSGKVLLSFVSQLLL